MALTFTQRFPRTSTPRAARSIQRILDAAAALFGNEGYERASMGRVARAAGVSKGLLHYHFDSKEHLLIEAQRATFRQIHMRFMERASRGERGVETAGKGLDALWQGIRDMRSWSPFMVETMSLGNQSASVRPQLDRFYEETTGLLEEGIRELLSDDLDALAVPPDRLAFLIRTVLQGMVVELARADSDAQLARVDQAYRDLRALFERFATAGDPPSSQG